MRYRELSPTGDYVFGRGPAEFLVNTPQTVGQAVKTRLLLLVGEWFLNVTDGTPYATKILGTNTKNTYDTAIRERILDTPGVTQITEYFSAFNSDTRALTVTATIDTIYGSIQITQVL